MGNNESLNPSPIKHNSDSTEQTVIESIVRTQLTEKLGIEFITGIIELEGISFQVDFYDETKFVYGEIFARVGELKSGQKRKICMDILKLLTIEKLLGKPIKKYIVFTDKKIEEKFKSKTWYSKSILCFDLQIICINLTQEQQDLLKEVRKRQYR
ncbi:hypothetical protein [Parasediminibacterium sp. JCM 36343]|uniref:hypothetical protein n=1 Tax=Parasediminibacterium sp. JCM 36343 TaxID=3374279 RepID=UPI00397B849E